MRGGEENVIFPGLIQRFDIRPPKSQIGINPRFRLPQQAVSLFPSDGASLCTLTDNPRAEVRKVKQQINEVLFDLPEIP